ncbi:MAG: hypothetical protein OXG16_06880 [Rhodospirillales bacterium]|nr:hypothetical protein [Rhodospirillales bacterium]
MNASIHEAVTVTPAERNIYDLLVEGILRLGAVLLAVYVMQLLFSLIRHQIQLAEDLEQRADLVDLANGSEEKLEKFASLLVAHRDNFGRIPHQPYDKFVDVIKEIATKLPSK